MLNGNTKRQNPRRYLSMRAVCPSCMDLFSEQMKKKRIEVPQLTVVEMVAEQMEVVALLMVFKSFSRLFNLGNYGKYIRSCSIKLEARGLPINR